MSLWLKKLAAENHQIILKRRILPLLLSPSAKACWDSAPFLPQSSIIGHVNNLLNNGARMACFIVVYVRLRYVTEL